MIVVCILMPPEKERLQWFKGNLSHFYSKCIFGFCSINPTVLFLKVELSLIPFKDSSKIVIIHRGFFKANSKFNTKEGWVAKKGRSRWEVCHQYKNGEWEKCHRSWLILWLKSALGVCSQAWWLLSR